MLDGKPMSDIRGTKSMQDAINLLWAYLFSAADHASLPARVITGQEPPKVPILDSSGAKIGDKPIDLEQLERGRMLWLTGQNAKIDQWDPASLNVFTEVTEKAIGHIAAQTRTPPHYLVTNKGLANLSGDALIAAETGLVKKVEEQQLYFSAAMREVFRLMAMVRGMRRVAEQLRTAEVQWKDPAMRSDAQRADSLIKKKQVGYPMRYLLESDGHSPSEIERIMGMVRDEQAMDPLAAATAAVRQGFLMSLDSLTDQHLNGRQLMAQSAAAAVASIWRTSVDPRNIIRSWRAAIPQAAESISEFQTRAAMDSESYMAATVLDMGLEPSGPRLNPA